MRRQAEPNILASKKTKRTHHGWYRGEHGDGQICMCTVCGQRFRDSLGLEYHHVPLLCITPALMAWGMGMPVGNIQVALKRLGVAVHQGTIQDAGMPFHYSGAVQKYAKTLKPPCVGDKRSCDEKRQDVRAGSGGL